MENTTRYQNYKDFFPFYLREHSKKSTRLLHYFGTMGYQLLFWSLLVTQNFIFFSPFNIFSICNQPNK